MTNKIEKQFCVETDDKYDKYADAGACCISSNEWHQNCYCDSAVTTCKELCDQDLNCKGYVNRGPNDCNIATTSDCSAIDCTGPWGIGNVGKLVRTCTASESSTEGCYIKKGVITIT